MSDDKLPDTPPAPPPSERYMFGLNPAIAVGSPVALWWGARAIYRGYASAYYIDLLHDRQSWSDFETPEAEANRPARKLLMDWMNTYGLKLMRKALKASMVQTHDEGITTVSDRGFHIIADPRASHGYLYLAAWKDPHATDVPDPESSASPPQAPPSGADRSRAKRRR